MCVYVVCMLSNNQGNGIFLQASDRHALLVHSSTSAPPVDFLLTCLLSIMCGPNTGNFASTFSTCFPSCRL